MLGPMGLEDSGVARAMGSLYPLCCWALCHGCTGCFSFTCEMGSNIPHSSQRYELPPGTGSKVQRTRPGMNLWGHCQCLDSNVLLFFLVALGFELRASHLLSRYSYCLNHSISPFL
jgi:hypothetical protein